MTTEVEIFKKYKPTEDGWISNTKFRQAIHDAYSAGKADGVYLLDKALATKGAMATDAYEKTLRNAYTETNVKDTEAYKMGYADGDWANYYAKHKGSAPSIYDEAEAQVKQKTAQAIFEELDDTQRTQTTEVIRDLIIIKRYSTKPSKHKYLKVNGHGTNQRRTTFSEKLYQNQILEIPSAI